MTDFNNCRHMEPETGMCGLHGNKLCLYFYDINTALPNREKLAADMEARKRRSAEGMFLLCLHITSMQDFINVYGRVAGGRLLSNLAGWLREEGYPGTLYHVEAYGFCMVLEDTDADASRQIAAQIQERFEGAWHLTEGERDIACYCTVSMALVCMNEAILHGDILDLVHRTLVLSEKEGGLLVYDSDMDRNIKEFVRFGLDLKNCVRSGMQGFDVHFQPIVDSRRGLWRGLEALCRWNCPGRGNVPPDAFIPEAERLGLIGALGEWVLDTSVRVCKDLELDQLEGFFLSVNISALQLIDANFVSKVAEVLRRHSYPGNRLSLELTESSEFNFGGAISKVVERLRKLGVQMALDDFGTGYSSFNSLKNLPVNFLKTERTFVEDIEKNTHLQYYYYIMSEIAHINGMKLIAEGIETREQLDIIVNDGADYIQGYYYSKPLPVKALEAQLERFTAPYHAGLRPEAEQFDIAKWLGGNDAYQVTPNLFRLLNKCMEQLLDKKELDTCIRDALETMGSHFHVDRAFAIFHEDDLDICQSHVWLSPETCGGSLRRLYPSIHESAYQFFLQGERTILTDIQELSEGTRELLAQCDIHSLLLLPMWDDDKLVGVAGFADHHQRQWTPEEVLILWNVSRIMTLVSSQASLQAVDHGHGKIDFSNWQECL